MYIVDRGVSLYSNVWWPLPVRDRVSTFFDFDFIPNFNFDTCYPLYSLRAIHGSPSSNRASLKPCRSALNFFCKSLELCSAYFLRCFRRKVRTIIREMLDPS